MFPVITNKNTFIEKIQHKEEIGILDKGDFTVIQYNVEKPDTFDSIEAMECRGIVFCNKTGKVLRRPFEKFWNVNQRDHTLAYLLDETRKIVRMTEKLDGTMISPFMLNGEIFWGTKRCANEFNEYIKNSGIINDNLKQFILDMIADGYTPMFEYHDPSFEGTCIVVNYPQRFIRLLAVRDNTTGEYLPTSQLANNYDIDVLTESKIPFNSVQHAVESVQQEENHEGYVMELDDGSRVKLKTLWYCQKHRLIDFFITPWMMNKLVVDFMLVSADTPSIEAILLWNPAYDGDGDDVIANMNITQKDAMQTSINTVSGALDQQWEVIMEKLSRYATKKELGLSDDFFGKNISFRCFEEGNIRKELLKEMQNKHFISNRNCNIWINHIKGEG